MPPFGLVLASIASVQFGAALAATLFDELGPVGTTLLRTAFAGVILVALWRPRPVATTLATLLWPGSSASSWPR